MERIRRPRGTGTIERKRGRYLARLPTLDREPLGICDTHDAAAALLDGWLALQAAGHVKPTTGTTLADFGKDWLDRRELDGFRSVEDDRSRWRSHIAQSELADFELGSITRADVIEWIESIKSKRAGPGNKQKKRFMEKRTLARSTIQNTLNLLRGVLADALHRQMIRENPADGVRLRMREERTEEPWTWLTLNEQRDVFSCEDIPKYGRLIIQFAIGTGMRIGELWNLELRDLHAGKDEENPRVFVRFGSKGRLPKNGRTRTVPLFGLALEAARVWLDGLARFAPKNPAKLVFPTERGCRRSESKPPGGKYVDGKGKVRYRFHDWLRAAGIVRDVRFHDLRHTCASSLVSGIWGGTWSQEKVRDLLGHRSVKTTERYAHLAPSALRDAAADMPASGFLDKPPVSHHGDARFGSNPAPLRRLERPTHGLGTRGTHEQYQDPNSLWRRIGGLVRELTDALAALGKGEAHALRQVIVSAESAAALLAEIEAELNAQETEAEPVARAKKRR